MLKIKEPYSIIDQKKYLIDFANLKQGLILNQNNFLNKKRFNNFLKKFYLGVPMLLPNKIKYFNYDRSSNNKIFKISKTLFAKKIFVTNKMNYKPLKIFFFFGNKFCSNVTLKKEYKDYVNRIISFNHKLKEKVKGLKKKGYTIGAFQTRNIPHLGHEKIISKLLNECDYVFINPVIGVKKRGDAKTDILKKVYKYLIQKHYNNRVIFSPVYASMFYAGPREAIHHALIRQSLGFDKFIIGRDHAGAENVYNPNAAFDYAKKYQHKLKIKLILLKGSYYCQKCQKAVISGECETGLRNKTCKKNLIEISGTNFRRSLIKKKLFKYARPDLQKYVNSLNKNRFY